MDRFSGLPPRLNAFPAVCFDVSTPSLRSSSSTLSESPSLGTRLPSVLGNGLVVGDVGCEDGVRHDGAAAAACLAGVGVDGQRASAAVDVDVAILALAESRGGRQGSEQAGQLGLLFLQLRKQLRGALLLFFFVNLIQYYEWFSFQF